MTRSAPPATTNTISATTAAGDRGGRAGASPSVGTLAGDGVGSFSDMGNGRGLMADGLSRNREAKDRRRCAIRYQPSAISDRLLRHHRIQRVTHRTGVAG